MAHMSIVEWSIVRLDTHVVNFRSTQYETDCAEWHDQRNMKQTAPFQWMDWPTQYETNRAVSVNELTNAIWNKPCRLSEWHDLRAFRRCTQSVIERKHNSGNLSSMLNIRVYTACRGYICPSKFTRNYNRRL